MFAFAAHPHIALSSSTATQSPAARTARVTFVKAYTSGCGPDDGGRRAARTVIAAPALLGAFPALADVAQSAATSGSLTQNPAFLGFSCVAVCWGIPQLLGTAILEKKEANGRALLKRAGIDTSNIGPGNWGKIQRLCQENGIDYKEQIL